MADRFTKEDLIKKGYTQNPDTGQWEPPQYKRLVPDTIAPYYDPARCVELKQTDSSYKKALQEPAKDWNQEIERQFEEAFRKNAASLLKTREECTGNGILDAVVKGRPKLSTPPVVDRWESFNKIHVLCLGGSEKGLNHDLMQKHWSVSYKSKKAFNQRIADLNPNKIKGQVKVTYIRHSAGLMDWDNLGSTCKRPFDALVKNGVIEADSPKCIVEFTMRQMKCKRKDAHMEFFIEEV